MQPQRHIRVKICCIQSVEEARLAVAYGAAAIGLVSHMPSGPGVISEEEIAQIADAVPPGVATFLLTSRQDAETIIAQQQRCRVNTLQLVDRVTPETHRQLRAALPGIGVVQVVHVTGEASIAEAERIAPYVDAILLDSGNPKRKVKELGGTGRVHDWTVSRVIRERVGLPIYLAGGLRPDNVGEALRRVGPFGVDLCTGVRTHGRLDESKLAHFFAAVRRTETSSPDG